MGESGSHLGNPGGGGRGGPGLGVFGPPPRETLLLERDQVAWNHANDGQHRAV
jgi:hypothetical protein